MAKPLTMNGEDEPLINEEPKLKDMTDESKTASSGFCTAEVGKLLLEKMPPQLKELWSEHGPTVCNVLGKVSSITKEHAQLGSILHGVFLIFYGGSWAIIAQILAFMAVYDMQTWKDNVKCFTRLTKASSGKDEVTPALVVKALSASAVLFTCAYGVWFSPLLTAGCIAIALEPYVTESIMSSPAQAPITQCLTACPPISAPYVKLLVSLAVRTVLGLLGWLVFPNAMCSIYLGVFGATKAFMLAGQKVKDVLNNSNVIPGLPLKTAALWFVVILGTMWQGLCGFSASFFHWIVPFGFIIVPNLQNVGPQAWVDPASNKDL